MNIPWLIFCKEVEDPGVVRTDLADKISTVGPIWIWNGEYFPASI
jgi:hypothetical protein